MPSVATAPLFPQNRLLYRITGVVQFDTNNVNSWAQWTNVRRLCADHAVPEPTTIIRATFNNQSTWCIWDGSQSIIAMVEQATKGFLNVADASTLRIVYGITSIEISNVQLVGTPTEPIRTETTITAGSKRPLSPTHGEQSDRKRPRNESLARKTYSETMTYRQQAALLTAGCPHDIFYRPPRVAPSTTTDPVAGVEAVSAPSDQPASHSAQEQTQDSQTGTSSALKYPSTSYTTARTGPANPERQAASTAAPRRVSRLSRLFSLRTAKNSRKALANRTSTASITAAVPTMTDASATTSDASTDLSNTDWAAGFVSVMQYRRLEQDTEDIRRKIAAKKRENEELLCCIAEQNQLLREAEKLRKEASKKGNVENEKWKVRDVAYSAKVDALQRRIEQIRTANGAQQARWSVSSSKTFKWL